MPSRERLVHDLLDRDDPGVYRDRLGALDHIRVGAFDLGIRFGPLVDLAGRSLEVTQQQEAEERDREPVHEKIVEAIIEKTDVHAAD